jgi:hypothetical protein
MSIVNSMPTFTALGKYTRKDKDIYSVYNDRECENFNHLIGCNVKIDDKIKKIIGVERFCHNPPWRKGEKIGLACEKSQG